MSHRFSDTPGWIVKAQGSEIQIHSAILFVVILPWLYDKVQFGLVLTLCFLPDDVVKISNDYLDGVLIVHQTPTIK